jgi:hypothetical protein
MVAAHRCGAKDRNSTKRASAHNFVKPMPALGKNTTPAMAEGLADHVWTPEEVAALLD